MLGIFKGKSKDKIINDNKETQKKDEKKYSLKKSKSQDKEHGSGRDKRKEDKFSRFSFKRSKSLEKKKVKDNNGQSGNLFSVSSTPSLLNEKDEYSEDQNEIIPAEDTDREDESETHSSYTVSSSDITSTSMSEIPTNESLSSASTYQQNNSTNDALPDRTSDSSSNLNLVSDQYLRNCKTYPRKVPVYQRSFYPQTESPILTVLTTSSYSVPSISPYIVRKTDSQSSISEASYKQSCNSTGDGSISMLSTPSSSTSSLSSISGRPISPSGRRTPPGPKLGTGGRIPSSPTTIRKTTRSNIKTNPTVFGRRQGPLSSPVAMNVSVTDTEKTVPSAAADRVESEKSVVLQATPPPNTATESSVPVAIMGQTNDPTGEISQESFHSPPQSPSPVIGRPRLSVSSMQSLESIPENESDLSSDSNDKLISSLRKMSNNKKIPPKLNISIIEQKCKGTELYNDQTNKSPSTFPVMEEEHGTTTTGLNNILPSPTPPKQAATLIQNEPTILGSPEPVVTKKPPLVVKKNKETNRPPQLREIKEKPKLKLAISSNVPNGKNDTNESLCNNISSSAKEDDPGNIVSAEVIQSEATSPYLSNKQETFKKPSINENLGINEQKFSLDNNEPGTHVIFRIPLSSSGKDQSKVMKRATSLEIMPTISVSRHSFKEAVFPRSSSPLRSISRRGRSVSMPKCLSLKEEMDGKFELPITLEELKKQAENMNSFRLKNSESQPIKEVTPHHLQNGFDPTKEYNQSTPKTRWAVPSQDSKIIFVPTQEMTALHTEPSSDDKTKEPETTTPQISRWETLNSERRESDYSLTSDEEEESSSISTDDNTEENENTNELITKLENKKEAQKNKTIKTTNYETKTTLSIDDEDIVTETGSKTSDSTSESELKSRNIFEYSEIDSIYENNDYPNVIQEAIRIKIDDKPSKCHECQGKERKLALESKLVQTEENAQEEAEREEEFKKRIKKELGEQEQKYQSQIDELTIKLAEKQQEVVDLVEELTEARQQKRKSSHEEDLRLEIEDMKKEVKLKENTAESYKVELHYVKNENEICKLKIQRLEDDLKRSKELVSSLQEQNDSRARDILHLKESDDKAKKLEEELRKSESVRKDLQDSLNEIEVEREEELKIVQDALDEAAQEREELIMTFEKELKHLNTTNTTREQQMMEDFEWKLREMEKDHKKKLDEKERQLEAGLNAVRSVVESEMADSLTKIAEDRRIADEKLAEVGHLRSYEAEAIQLRGVTHEFQKALRASAREMENIKIREKLLEEEIRSLRTGSQFRQSTLHRVNKCHNDEEEFRQKLERQKSEINAKWEDKLRSECSRLKSELDDLHSEEKHLAVESMKVQKEQEMQALKKSWEKNQEEMNKKISTLKDSLTEKDAYYHKEVERQRTIADRDIWDLRMKLQKLTESSFDKQQQLEEKYREDMERFRSDYDDRVRELESRLAAREADAGIDLMGNLEKEHKSQMQHLEEQHRLSMERLREELDSEKFQAVEDARLIITKHHEGVVAELKDQINEYTTTLRQCREEVESLRQTVTRRDETLRSLREELERCQESRGVGDSYPNLNTPPPNFSPSSASSGLSSSEHSLASSSDSHGSQGSRTSQDRFYLPENFGVLDNPEDSQRVSNTGIFGKMFGGGWFSPAKGKDGGRRAGTPLSNKKAYGS